METKSIILMTGIFLIGCSISLQGQSCTGCVIDILTDPPNTTALSCGVSQIKLIPCYDADNADNIFWTLPSGALNQNDTLLITGIPSSPDTFILNVKMKPGTPNCSNATITDTIIITQTNAPSITLSTPNPEEVCKNGQSTLTATITNPGMGCTITWQVRDEGSSTWLTINGATGTMYTTDQLQVTKFYRVIYNCTNCMATSNEKKVTVVTPPVANNITINSGTSSVCYNSSTTLSVTTIQGCSISWEKNDGSGWGSAGNGMQINTGNLTKDTDFRVTYTCTPCAPVTSPAKKITVNPELTASIEPNPTGSVCPLTNVILTAKGTGGKPGYTYKWEDNSTVSPRTVAPSVPSTYQVTISDANSPTCMATSSITINMKPTVGAAPASTGPYCAGATIKLIANPSVTGGPYNFSWAGPGGTAIPNSSAENPVIPNAVVGNNGTYTVTVSGGNVCSKVATIEVKVYSDPTVNITTSTNSTVFCSGGGTELTANLSFTDNKIIPKFKWYKQGAPSTTLSTNAKCNIQSLTQGGTYIVEVTYPDSTACNNIMAEIPLTIIQNPLPNITGPTSVCRGAKAIYYLTGDPETKNFNASDFVWTVPSGATVEYIADSTAIVVTWAQQGGNVRVRQKVEGGTCSWDSPNLNVTVENTTAPTSDSLCHFNPNHILIHSDDSYDCYQWGFYDRILNVDSTLTGEIYQAYGAGNTYNPDRFYWVKAWNGNCTTPTGCVTISYRTKICGTGGNTPRLLLYPNPTPGAFQVEVSRLKASEYTLVVNDVLGRIVEQRQVQVGADGLLNETVRLDGVAGGLYYVALRHDKGTLLAKAVSVLR